VPGAPGTPTAFEIEVFYDGACPLCRREAALLRRLDRNGHIRFADITAEGFDAATVGIPFTTLMDRIHGRLADGTLVEGVEVFRRVYTAVGCGALVAPTRLPGVAQLLDLAYRLFAKNRLRLTGRCAPGVLAPVSGTGGPKAQFQCLKSGVQYSARVRRRPRQR
jgi:predicted DCC family thiol-disulfide oxidoreductase YuxK